jgi:acetyl esterase/lipase
MSPWTDLALTGESYRTKLADSIDPPGMSTVCSKYYVGDNDPCLPWISPLYGDLHGLPPLFISIGTNETMLDDSLRFVGKAEAAGVEVTLKVGEGMIHCYPLLAPLFPEATEAMNEICAFLGKHLGQ